MLLSHLLPQWDPNGRQWLFHIRSPSLISPISEPYGLRVTALSSFSLSILIGESCLTKMVMSSHIHVDILIKAFISGHKSTEVTFIPIFLV